MFSISLVSLNIERSKHLDRVIPFLLERDPDVVCIQELLERDIPYFEKTFGMQCVFGPSGLHLASELETEPVMMMGSALLSRLPIGARKIEYYAGSEERARRDAPQRVLHNSKLITCDVEKDASIFRIATTHFTWTPHGRPNDEQREDMRHLFKLLASAGEFVLAGDFNAPRGGEIFTAIAERYKDNIPAKYTTSIDGSLHRAGNLQLMVDGIFSTPAYEVSDVELHTGISDHCAITATIAKKLDRIVKMY
ncbi:endonuclease/exonuclease/phosphatase family protein [Candidatus Kaiserbacteria bacterium]|nr:endonuclease/exonuclease/phosphatase family protein [Candidatus Kaiserbacteria bacterium]